MATATTTATVTVFPTTQDVVGGSGYSTTGDGKTLREPLLAQMHAMPFADIPYVKSGGAYQLVSGRTVRYTTAWACIAGYIVRTLATPETLTCYASATSYVWLQLVRNVSGQVTGARWAVTDTATAPTLPTNGVTGDQVMFGQVACNASAVTAQYDTYRGIITPGKRTHLSQQTSNTDVLNNGANGASLGTFILVGDGYTKWDLEFTAVEVVCNNGAGRLRIMLWRDGIGTGANDRIMWEHELLGATAKAQQVACRALAIDPGIGAKRYDVALQNVNIGAGANITVPGLVTPPAAYPIEFSARAA